MTKSSVQTIKVELQQLADPEKAAFFPTFFKAGPGEYAEGDQFIGVTVPNQRKLAKKFAQKVTLTDIKQLLHSPIHEYRLTALLLLVAQFETGSHELQEQIKQFYLAETDRINNWDLVDISAHKILGQWILDHPADQKILTILAKADHLWQNRIAMVATWQLIRAGQLQPTLEIATILLNHSHDLIHKAVGWMLREVGKKDHASLETFLDQHFKTMPRTMLRYAIEKFSPELRNYYLGRKPTKP